MNRELIQENKLLKIENMIEHDKNIDIRDKNFSKLMFIYELALKELKNKIEILKQEFEILYEYELIDDIDSRIKSPDSIIEKMEDRKLQLTYKNLIENINDIAGARIICPLKKDVYTVKEIMSDRFDINIIKEKDYIKQPKKSGYQSYHLIIEIPVNLSKQSIYVKTEIQIRTIAMDLWSNLEHKMKYKGNKEISKSYEREWVNCAKMINKFDEKLLRLNT